jgi:hypothetical protein
MVLFYCHKNKPIIIKILRNKQKRIFLFTTRAKYAHILLEKSLFFKRTNTFVGSVFDYLAKLYNFDTKHLQLGSNRLQPPNFSSKSFAIDL